MSPVLFQAEGNYDRAGAERVAAFFERISGPRSESPFLRQATFSEIEFNSYFNLIHIPLQLPELRYLEMSFSPGNRISGRLQVELQADSYRLLPSGLRNARVEFSGLFECQAYQGRFILDELKVNGAAFSPNLLDELIQLVQSGKTKKKSLFDWYPLLPGLKQVKTGQASVTLFY